MFVALAAYSAPQPLEFNIRDIGAIGDGVALNTLAIQAAIDRVSLAGGGVVVFPSGKFLTGSLTLKSRVTLNLQKDAVLLGSANPKDYPPHPFPKYRSLRDQFGFPALIYAEEVSHIAVIGEGTIDGQGAFFKKQSRKNDEDTRPRCLLFVSCNDVRVQGLHLRNSGSWLQHYLNCENVEIKDLDIFNHSTGNNDCLDVDGCRHVRISGLKSDTDDDGLTFKSTGPAICEDVVCTDCTIASHCNAIKCGTETTGGFRRIRISNIAVVPSVVSTTINGTARGLSGIALMITDGGILDDVTISKVTIKGTLNPLYIRLGNRGRKYKEDAPTPGIGIVRNIVIEDVTATDVGGVPSWICGLPDHPVENVTLRNIRITGPGFAGNLGDSPIPEMAEAYPDPKNFAKAPASCLFIRHARNVTLDHLSFTTTSGDPRSPLFVQDVQGFIVKTPEVTMPAPHPAFLQVTQVKDSHVQAPQGWGDIK